MNAVHQWDKAAMAKLPKPHQHVGLFHQKDFGSLIQRPKQPEDNNVTAVNASVSAVAIPAAVSAGKPAT